MKCFECGNAMTKTEGDYNYDISGLDNIVLKNVVIHICECGENEVEISSTVELHNLIALFLVIRPSSLAGKEACFLRKRLGLTQEEFADALKVQRGSVARWENSKKPLSPDRSHHVRLLFLSKIGQKFSKSLSVFNATKVIVNSYSLNQENPEIKIRQEDWMEVL